MILAGDIGGTKTHLALFKDTGKLERVNDEKYVSKDYPNLIDIINVFLTKHPAQIEKACFGIAGPVQNNRCKTTNLPWIIDGSEIGEHLKTKNVWLINDLEANANGLSVLAPNEFFVLNEGVEQKNENKALISAGTGLGEAGIFWDGTKYHPFASEGGHADFAPRDELEMELLRYLKPKFDHVSFERLLSGKGIVNIYKFLIDMGLEKETQDIKVAMTKEDPARVITQRALNKESKACQRALHWFVSIYGAEAGNLALKFLALSGVYIGGGIAPKILSVIQSGEFMKSFVAKGRFSTLLSNIPVKIVLNENTALLGAAVYAKEKK